jgi:ATP-dependent Lon protease
LIHDRSFLANARAQLDADHFGLEKIKKRLIEYLAVVRLKELNAAREDELALAQADSGKAKGAEKSPVPAGDTSSPQPTSDVPKRSTRRTVKGPILL